MALKPIELIARDLIAENRGGVTLDQVMEACRAEGRRVNTSLVLELMNRQVRKGHLRRSGAREWVAA